MNNRIFFVIKKSDFSEIYRSGHLIDLFPDEEWIREYIKEQFGIDSEEYQIVNIDNSDTIADLENGRHYRFVGFVFEFVGETPVPSVVENAEHP